MIGRWVFHPYSTNLGKMYPVVSSYVNLDSGVRGSTPLILLGDIEYKSSPRQSTVVHKTASHNEDPNRGYPYTKVQDNKHVDGFRNYKPIETIQESQRRIEENKKSTKDVIKNSNITSQNFNTGDGIQKGVKKMGSLKNMCTENCDQNNLTLLQKMCGKLEVNRYESGNTIDILDFPWKALMVYIDDLRKY